ncbi:MAG: AI-2E family transporter [Candidatus Pacebacteria bacterium]|nr:AI-2E family transporter [Candidatus Paceibacterota bacterium]MCF7862895.1 AI-2E family transporter [Candidatus Paceibacterota bacterium]
MQEKNYTSNAEKYFFFALLLGTLIFTFFIFQPFWMVLVLGACFSIVLRPIYEKFKKLKFPSWLASMITVFLFAVLVCGPLFGMGIIIFNQTQDLYRTLIEGGGIPTLASINDKIQHILPNGIDFDIHQKTNDLIYMISNNLGKIFSATLTTIFSFGLTLLAIFYFLKDGSEWKKSLITLSPLADTDDLKIINRMTIAINGIIKGYLLIGVIQGIIMGIGLAIFGVPSPALWGVVAAISSLIPTVGTALISIPAVIFLFATGNAGSAIGLAIWSVAIVSTIDNLLNPYIVGSKIKIPPFLILFSVLGGMALLGWMGILLGPLIVSLLYTLVYLYRGEFQNTPTTN